MKNVDRVSYFFYYAEIAIGGYYLFAGAGTRKHLAPRIDNTRRAAENGITGLAARVTASNEHLIFNGSRRGQNL